MVNTTITTETLKASIEKFYDGFFDVMEFYTLPRGVGFTGRRFNAEHTAYVELKNELADQQRLEDVLENFKTHFIKDNVKPIGI